jgi:uncharacterized protein
MTQSELLAGSTHGREVASDRTRPRIRIGPTHARGAAVAASVFVALLTVAAARAAVEIPAAPQNYFNDYAGLVSPSDAERLNDKLRAFDEESSTQIVVAIFPGLPEPSLEDFTVRTAQAWRVGQKKLDNGAVLFVFVKDRKTRIEVGYGLEGSLPDATCKDILEDKLTPAFRQGQFAAGLETAIDSMIAATKGEYQAQPRRRTSGGGRAGWSGCVPFLIFFFVIPFLLSRRVGRTFGGGGWWTTGGWGGFGGGGGFSGGGGGGFSGGGGSFGGGGASGSW